MPHVRDHILTLLDHSPNGGGFATPITNALIRLNVVGQSTSPIRIASVLTGLHEEGLVSVHLRNEWRITDQGRQYLAARAN